MADLNCKASFHCKYKHGCLCTNVDVKPLKCEYPWISSLESSL